MSKIMVIIGTRPEITKMAPIIRRILESKMDLILIHSGQHYDYQMSTVFLKELKLPKIDKNLEIGSGSHAYQTSQMLQKYEEVFIQTSPDIVLAVGDTNTVVAASLVCAKLNIPFGHVESGIRSYDFTMPEEINRRIADSISSLYFAPTKQSVKNLYYEGIDTSRIFLTGNTAVDATLEHSEIAKVKSTIIDDLNIDTKKPLITMTLHRAGNVDNKEKLKSICEAITELEEYTIVYPVHPRTKKRLEEFKLLDSLEKASHIILTEPLGYLDFLNLMQNSILLMTDSGGLQEEGITLRKPCITLRENTERPETVKLGVNFLAGANKELILELVKKIVSDNTLQKKLEDVENPFGDGKASHKILRIIQEAIKNNSAIFQKPELLEKGSYNYRLILLEQNGTKNELEERYKGKITLVYNKNGFPEMIPEEIPKGWYIRVQY